MEFHATGDLALWQGIVLAVLFALTAWYLYRREVKGKDLGRMFFLVPLFRSLVVFLIILCLTGPVVSYRFEEGAVGRVVAFVDGSQSMTLTDGHMDPGRKLLYLLSNRLVPKERIDTQLYDICSALGDARNECMTAQKEKTGKQLREASAVCREKVAEVQKLLNLLDKDMLPPTDPITGYATVEYFPYSGADVNQLRSSGHFDKQPSETAKLSLLQTPSNRGDNYTTRIRGYFYPPETGDYTFWIASDDQSVLQIARAASPDQLEAVAGVSSFVSRNRWEDNASQKSRPIALEKGVPRYFEVLHKEQTGEDFVAVGWRTPAGIIERPVFGRHLMPFPMQAMEGDAALSALQKLWRKEVLLPSQRLGSTSRHLSEIAIRTTLSSLSGVLSKWEMKFRSFFAVYAADFLKGQSGTVKDALERFDAMKRSERVEKILLDGDSGLLPQLAKTHRIEVVMLKGKKTDLLWRSQEMIELPETVLEECTGTATDLATGIREYMEEEKESRARTAFVLFSDGRHNSGPSPLPAATLAGDRGLPFFTVSLGCLDDPEDLALITVDSPDRVFAEDRVTGHLRIMDTMPQGRAFTVKILGDKKALWEETFKTDGRGVRRIDYDFPIEEFVKRRTGERGPGMEVFSLPVSLNVQIEPVEGESRRDNNERLMRFCAVTSSRKILLLDGRPRWEWRYIKNMFDRDRKWEIDAFIAHEKGKFHSAFTDAHFPKDRKELYAYQLIVFGDLPPDVLTEEQQEWICDFVQKRYGGLVILDGQRGFLKQYTDTMLDSLFPVEWNEGSSEVAPDALRLTSDGGRLSFLRLENDPVENATLWGMLPAPHWTASVKVREGAQVLAEAEKGEERFPVLVWRRFGGGRVFYLGFDETWRWRYKVGDRYQVKFWNQLVNFLTESSFAVSDQFVSLDPGGPVYEQGDVVRFRVRLRDRDGKPLLKARAQVIVYRDGEKHSTVKLAPDANQGGMYRGSIEDMKAGHYEARVDVEGFSPLQMKARCSFTVDTSSSPEFAHITCSETILQAMAASSGGRYLREEEAGGLVDVLKPFSEGKIVVREEHLAQSWWLFVPLVLLLTVEWIVRKRKGMV